MKPSNGVCFHFHRDSGTQAPCILRIPHAVIVKQGWFCPPPPGDTYRPCRYFELSQFRESMQKVLLASSGWRSGTLLNTLPCTGQRPPRRRTRPPCPRAKVEKSCPRASESSESSFQPAGWGSEWRRVPTF